jgi:hypothetical protein
VILRKRLTNKKPQGSALGFVFLNVPSTNPYRLRSKSAKDNRSKFAKRFIWGLLNGLTLKLYPRLELWSSKKVRQPSLGIEGLSRK